MFVYIYHNYYNTHPSTIVHKDSWYFEHMHVECFIALSIPPGVYSRDQSSHDTDEPEGELQLYNDCKPHHGNSASNSEEHSSAAIVDG